MFPCCRQITWWSEKGRTCWHVDVVPVGHVLPYRTPHRKLGKHEENGNGSDSVLEEFIFLKVNYNVSTFTEDVT